MKLKEQVISDAATIADAANAAAAKFLRQLKERVHVSHEDGRTMARAFCLGFVAGADMGIQMAVERMDHL